MNILFQSKFEEMIQSGRKYHTIRPKRKIPLRPGQVLSLRVWTGLPYRSKQREIHTSSVKKVLPVVIDSERIILDGVLLNQTQAEELAWHDGFSTLSALLLWFTTYHGLPFFGEIIYWRDPYPTSGYATAKRDGFTVPLIGIPAAAQPSAGDFRTDPNPHETR